MAVGWFTLVQSGIEPAQKADYLSALFDSPLLKAYVCAAFAVMTGFVFGELSGAEKRFLPNMLFSIVAGVYVAFVTQSISDWISLRLCCVGVVLFGCVGGAYFKNAGVAPGSTISPP